MSSPKGKAYFALFLTSFVWGTTWIASKIGIQGIHPLFYSAIRQTIAGICFVGFFVAIGFTLAILVFIWLGMSRFLQKGRFYVTYFDESVQGLDVDSPVKYRGVFIGRVESIGVAPDSKLIKVVLKIESGTCLKMF